MGIFLETWPIDVEAAHIHEQTPEFSRTPPNDDIAMLTPLADGSACLIQGSNSTEKRRLLRNLFDTLGIVHTDTIPVDTYAIGGKSLCFHAAYRPAANQILVARISHKDVLTFPAFRT